MNLEKNIPKKLAIFIIISCILFFIILGTTVVYIFYTLQEDQVVAEEKSIDLSMENVETEKDTVKDIFRNFDNEFKRSTEEVVSVILDKELYFKEINKNDVLKSKYNIDYLETAYVAIEGNIKGDQYNELKKLYRDLLINHKERLEDFKKRVEYDENLL